MNYVVGIAGGSGSGKSTVSFGLEDMRPGKVVILHLDDYFKPEAEVPKLRSITNWDDPGALYIDKMTKDLALLKAGKSTIVNTKSPRLNPSFLQTGRRIPIEFYSKPLIVVEGFLALHFQALRELMDLKIYLDVPDAVRATRRVHGKLHDFPADYDEYILRPMYEQYVLPSKVYADQTIDVGELDKAQVLARVAGLINL